MRNGFRGIATALLAVLPAAGALAQDITLTAPAQAAVGAAVQVDWQGGGAPQDFITIVAAGTPEGRYDQYQYARQSPVTLVAPASPGDYEIRYLGAATPYPTIARRPLRIVDVAATLEAPASVDAGSEFPVTWTGPDYPRDFITLVPAGTAEGQYATYAYSHYGKIFSLKMEILFTF